MRHRMLRLQFYFLFIIQLYTCFTCAEIIESKWDLPTERDLNKYLSGIKNIVNFSAANKTEIDLNLAFGLFLTNANLGHAFLNKQKTIPANLKSTIKNIIDENNEVLTYFTLETSLLKNIVEEDVRRKIVNIFALLSNASHWVESLEEFVYTEERQFRPDQFKDVFSSFDLYMKNVANVHKLFPGPVESDNCLVSLSESPRDMNRSPPQCSANKLCYDMLKQGTNYGYALTHRIVFLLMARIGRRCSVFSEQTDRALVKRFCSMSHAEAVYISENSYGMVDLFMEIIALCTIDGHSQFLRRIWLDNILKFQRPDGCFEFVPVKRVNPTSRHFFKTRIGKNSLLEDGCKVHPTGLAAATLAAAVRFIIEVYY